MVFLGRERGFTLEIPGSVLLHVERCSSSWSALFYGDTQAPRLELLQFPSPITAICRLFFLRHEELDRKDSQIPEEIDG